MKKNKISNLSIVSLLSKGYDNAVSRKDLISILKISDRCLRQNIKSLRLKGYPILSTSRNSGYFLPSNDSEVQSFINENSHRIRELVSINDSMKLYMLRNERD